MRWYMDAHYLESMILQKKRFVCSSFGPRDKMKFSRKSNESQTEQRDDNKDKAGNRNRNRTRKSEI